MGTALGGGATLGGGSTLGGVYTLGCVSTLGGGVHLGMDSTLGGWSVTGSGVVGTGGGISEAVSGFHDPKRSCSLEISSMWLWCSVAGSYLMAQ